VLPALKFAEKKGRALTALKFAEKKGRALTEQEGDRWHPGDALARAMARQLDFQGFRF